MRLFLCLFTCLALVVLLASCAASSVTPTATAMPARTLPPAGFAVTDALSRQVTFERAPQRIAVAGKGVRLVADALYLFPEASSRIIALGDTAQGKYNFIPVIDSNYTSKIALGREVGPEQIAAVKPDAVLLKSYTAEKLGKPLQTLDIPVVYLDFETAEQYWRDLTTLGQLFQNEIRAKQIISFYQERVARITRTLADVKEDQKPRALILYYTDRDGAVAFNVPPMGWMQTWMLQTAGGRPAWKDAPLGQGWTKVSFEQIAAWNADQIYIIAYFNNVNDVIKTLKTDTQWQGLRAVKQGKLYGFPRDYYSWDEPSPRWILGLTWLASQIYPDRFASVNMEQEVRTFYREMYNLDDAAYQKHIQPNLIGDFP